MAREVGGGAVGACVGVLAGWRRGQLVRRKAVVAPMNSAGVGRNFMEIYRTKSRRQRSFGCRPVWTIVLWRVCLNRRGNRRRPRWRGCGSRGGVLVLGYRKWSSSSGTTQAGGAGRIGLLLRRHSLVAVAALATWLGSPPIIISSPQALTKTRSRQSGRLPYGESVVLLSACKVVVPHAG